MICRLVHDIKPRIDAEWVPGDLAVGDSMTDYARCYYFDPMLPRTFNAGIMAARISDVVFNLQQIVTYFNNENKILNPSKIVVMAGVNDLLTDVNGVHNQFTVATQYEYYALFDYLRQLKSVYNCPILIRSLPQANLPDQPCYDSTQGNLWQAINETNAFLTQQAIHPLNQFVFVDHGTIFDGSPGTGLLEDYRTNLGLDALHWGCLGYQVALGILAQHSYNPLPVLNGIFSFLPSEPHGLPKSSYAPLPVNTYYRYALHYVPVNHTMNFTVSGSTFNYAAVFNPTFPTGYPQFEDAVTGGVAFVQFTNPFTFPCPVILCVGTAATPANYSVS